MNKPEDYSVRALALDPAQSFIVQAPAGSGKTELLTRRVLTLLRTVNEPEEILAITFTRKAASEMRQRVIETLEGALQHSATDDPYELEGRALATAVLERDKQLNWQLIRNPQRLNLRTIDSLATQLAHRLPVTSTLGAPTAMLEKADPLYNEAAQRFIKGNLDSLHLVLLHLGNKLDKAQSLLAGLLAKRDQWQRHVYGAGDDHDELRAILEGMLAELIESRLQNLCQKLPAGIGDQLMRCLGKAADYALTLADGDLSELKWEMQLWHSMESLPGDHISDLARWESISQAVLKVDNKPRKSLTVRDGFPAKAAMKKLGVSEDELIAHKQAMLEVLSEIEKAPEFLEALVEVRKLPDPQYKEEQWALLSQLLTVLPSLLLELQLVFAEQATVDFTEISARASLAMGADDAPTDLALSMDLTLKHLLIDEFQDTSQTQFKLFEKLLQPWVQGDGRTFFAVGDPMQSIYRFREADVALFMRVQRQGIGSVEVMPLTLSVIFRSSPIVTGWVNDTFGDVFPKQADADIGAVTYSASSAFRDDIGSVNIHPVTDAEKRSEALRVATLCAEAIDNDPEHSVAVLVRSRTHAVDILAALREHNLAYESVDMDLIGNRAVVRDLIALVFALRYPHDRLHWLALLRAPFIGLTLADLHALMEEAGSKASVIELLQNAQLVASLSDDGQQRVRRALSILEPALRRAMRSRFMAWVESVWLQLGGPSVCEDDMDHDAASRAIHLLYTLEARGELWSKSTIDAALAGLYANAIPGENVQIQVMTLHKSKGLEFDTVILPALDRKSRADGTQLLEWFESTLDGKPRLLLAPFERSGIYPKQRDRINKLVKRAGQRCDEQEKLRLLYVACTRAKRHLHLVARIRYGNEGEIKNPIGTSLLAPLWKVVKKRFAQSIDIAPVDDDKVSADAPVQAQLDLGDLPGTSDLSVSSNESGEESEICAPAFLRLPSDAVHPSFHAYEQHTLVDDATSSAKSSLDFKWAGRDARDIGTVVHDQLQVLSEVSSLEELPSIESQAAVVSRQLRNLGLNGYRVKQASAKVMRALSNTLADERGRWILSSHRAARSEWALSVPREINGAATATVPGVTPNAAVQRVIIDRTFIDDQDTRWIIDYKTSDHSGKGLDAFLDKECERYADQLNRYADIISRLEERSVRVGLYFPMLKAWREWTPPMR